MCLLTSKPSLEIPKLGKNNNTLLYGIDHIELQKYFMLTGKRGGKNICNVSLIKIMKQICNENNIGMDLLFPRNPERTLKRGPLGKIIHIGLLPLIFDKLPNTWKAINSITMICNRLKTKILEYIDSRKTDNIYIKKKFKHVLKQLETLDKNINFISYKYQIQNLNFPHGIIALQQDYDKLLEINECIGMKVKEMNRIEENTLNTNECMKEKIKKMERIEENILNTNECMKEKMKKMEKIEENVLNMLSEIKKSGGDKSYDICGGDGGDSSGSSSEEEEDIIIPQRMICKRKRVNNDYNKPIKKIKK